ncbi:DNA replication/repair protein RecF [Segnochrobactrum spirostomi]|uniref:DNA replication and repair protein RecF n=1 Tax=Segnochrobactrum spirostomi TaxID=2608987 RepID=A0A6A7Y3Q5_9HYPH|nr:DNA replication/repair protein RecF [Segnochrobactrum spirostomi]MQT13007.1 DNA replication/repair protein RecF [Segnochrobactrum spirostomi]
MTEPPADPGDPDTGARAAGDGAAPVRLLALQLADFRNYAALMLPLDGRPVVLTGDNGAGKTNLLEAVSLLSPGRGLRRATYEALARRGGSGGWSVAAAIEGPEGRVRIGTGLDPGGEGGRSRRIRIDGADARSAEALLDHIRVLWLTPAMDGLFTGPAGDRRRFLDRLVLAIDAAHASRVSAYERALAQRNRLLESHVPDPAWLDAVELQIAELGTAVAAARRELVACLAELAPEPDDTFPAADLALEGEIEARIAAGAPASAVEEAFRAGLAAGRGLDRAAGRTLTGPHRSDLVVVHRAKAMPAALASTGEQKALLIGLVLAHARLVARLTRQVPVLLLDEVAAHLDSHRRAGLFARLERLGTQAFMTGTDTALFEALGDRAQRFTVADGGVMPV